MSSDRRSFLREIARTAREVRAVGGAGRDAYADARDALLRGDLPEEAVPEREAGRLSPDEHRRYAGQLETPGWGEGEQLALRGASVLVVGAGAVGSPAALYLAGAGVGRLGLVDGAVVEAGELTGEPLHFTPDLEVPKVHSAAVKLGFLNPEVEVVPYEVELGADTAPGLLAGHDLVVDASNADATRAALHPAALAAALPLVAGGIGALRGWVMTVTPGGACVRCAFPDGSPIAGSPGGLGPVGGVVGSLLALEALKRLTGFAPPLSDAVLRIELDRLAFERVPVARHPDCPWCGVHPELIPDQGVQRGDPG